MARQAGFEDINVDGLGHGCLSGDGVEDHYSADVKQGQQGDGLHIAMACQRCGGRTLVIISWQELIIVSHGLVPTNWQYKAEHGRMTPNVACSYANCREWLPVLVSPDEAARHINAGVQSKQLDARVVQQVTEQIRQQQGRPR